MGELMRIEFDLDEERHCELCREAERLGVTPAEIARRAVAAWLIETEDDCLSPEPSAATGLAQA